MDRARRQVQQTLQLVGSARKGEQAELMPLGKTSIVAGENRTDVSLKSLAGPRTRCFSTVPLFRVEMV